MAWSRRSRARFARPRSLSASFTLSVSLSRCCSSSALAILSSRTRRTFSAASDTVLDDPPHDPLQLRDGERLRDVVLDPLPERLHRRLQGGVPGHEDDRQIRIDGTAAPEEFEAGEAGHLEVGDEEVGRLSTISFSAWSPSLRPRPRILPAPEDASEDCRSSVRHRRRECGGRRSRPVSAQALPLRVFDTGG